MDPKDVKGQGENIASAYRKAGPYIDASWQLAGSVGLGTVLGWFLDKKLHTGPWLLVVGALVGLAGSSARSMPTSRRPEGRRTAR